MKNLDKIGMFERIGTDWLDAHISINSIEDELDKAYLDVEKIQERVIKPIKNNQAVNEETVLKAFDESSNYSYLLYKAISNLEKIALRANEVKQHLELKRDKVNEFQVEAVNAMDGIQSIDGVPYTKVYD